MTHATQRRCDQVVARSGRPRSRLQQVSRFTVRSVGVLPRRSLALSPRVSCAAVIVALAVLVVGPRADAQTTLPSARLTYVRGAGAERCPDEAALRGAVAVRLGYDPFRADGSLQIAATLERASRGLVARVDVRGADGQPRGTRELSGSATDCAALASAMTLALSIAIDPMHLTRATPPATGTTPVSAGPAAPPTPDARPEPRSVSASGSASTASTASPDVRPASPRPVRHWDAVLRVGGVFSIATEPSLTGGLVVGVEARASIASLGIEVRGDVPGATSGNFGERVWATIIHGALVPCLRLTFDPVALRACGVASLGVLIGGADGVNEPRRDVTPHSMLGARIGVDVRLSERVEIGVQGDMLGVPTVTTLYVVEQSGSGEVLGRQRIWATPLFAGTLGVTIGLRFR